MSHTCILPLDHKWEYHSTDNGRSYWVCWHCGAVTFEMEESNGG